MTVRVEINGFGRIGSEVLRAIAEYDPTGITAAAIDGVETNVHLLNYGV